MFVKVRQPMQYKLLNCIRIIKIDTVRSLEIPALLIEKSILEEKIFKMQELMNKHNINLRPHIIFKFIIVYNPHFNLKKQFYVFYLNSYLSKLLIALITYLFFESILYAVWNVDLASFLFPVIRAYRPTLTKCIATVVLIASSK